MARTRWHDTYNAATELPTVVYAMVELLLLSHQSGKIF